MIYIAKVVLSQHETYSIWDLPVSHKIGQVRIGLGLKPTWIAQTCSGLFLLAHACTLEKSVWAGFAVLGWGTIPNCPGSADENGRKTSQPFSTSTFEYKNENKSGKAEHENKHELMEYREFRKWTNSNGIMLNTAGTRNINTEYWPVGLSAWQKCITINKSYNFHIKSISIWHHIRKICFF